MKKTPGLFFLSGFFLTLWMVFSLCTPATSFSQNTAIEADSRYKTLMNEPNPEEAVHNAVIYAVRAGRKQDADTRARVVELLGEVRSGKLDPEGFYQKVSKLDMPPGKELRHVLMEVKKDVGNYLGSEGLKSVFGHIYESGATIVEASILKHRKKVVMDTVKQAIVVYRDRVKAATGEYPKFSFYYGEVGGWPTESFDELKFAGDIDFNFLCGDLNAAMELKKIFDSMIVERYGRSPEELDVPCTVHGLATGEVYVGKHGQAFAEKVTKVAWEIDFENAGKNMDLKAKEVPFKDVLKQMVLEARVNNINNSIDDLQTLKWPHQPGISLEMIRHFEHDIVGKNAFTDLESFVKAAKYTDRSFDFLVDELKGGDEPVRFDERLSEFVTELTENKKDPQKQVDLIKEYFNNIGKEIPFEVNLEITPDGKTRATIEANEKFIKEFWDICRKSMWEGANQVLKKKTAALINKINVLGEKDIEASKAIYEELVKLDEMLEIEDRILHDEIAGIHEHMDAEYIKNMSEFREMRKAYKEKSAKFGHIEYIDPKLGKAYAWIETMLGMGKEFNIKMAWASILSAPGKFNDALDFLDDRMMTKLRYGGGDEYIKLLRKGQGLYWEERANRFLKGTGLEGRFDAQFKSMEVKYGQQVADINQWMNNTFAAKLASRGLRGIQTINKTFNEGVEGHMVEGALMKGMMVYSLMDELPLYYNYIGERDFGGLAAEFFKRRVPFGGAVERSVMGDYYGVAWEITATLIPPVGILAAASSVGEYAAQTGIDMVWSESFESFVDNLYDKAEFRIVSVETVGENIKISQWELLNVSYNNKKYGINDLIALETSDAREMAACMQKPSQDRWECFTMDLVYNGLFEWFNAKDAFEHKFEKTDSWIQLIDEMAKDKNIGEKLKDHFRFQRYARFEQIKVQFLKGLKVRLEERRAGEQALISGQFPEAYEEFMNIAEQLDIRPQIEKEMNEKFGGGITQFMTSLKDFVRGAVRDFRGDVDVWSVYEELSAYVTENLRAYKKILDGRVRAEEQLVLKKQDQGLRILTGPYFLNGVPSEDAASSAKWFDHVGQVADKTENTMSTIKAAAKVTPSELDLSEGAYDRGILDRLVYHESFKDMWKFVNSRMTQVDVQPYLGDESSRQEKPNPPEVMTDQDRALNRFSLHDQRIKETIEEFRNHYASAADGGDDRESKEKKDGEPAASDLDALLKEMTVTGDRINPVNKKLTLLISQIKTVKDQAAQDIKAVQAKLDSIGSPVEVKTQSEPFDDSVLRESADIEFLSKLVAALRTSMEEETLAVCLQYEKLKAEEKTSGLKKSMEDADSGLKTVKEKFDEYTQIKGKLDSTKEKARQALAEIAAMGRKNIDLTRLKEIETSISALKEKLKTLSGLAESAEEYNDLGAELKQRASSIMEKLNGYDAERITDEQKHIPDRIRTVYGRITEEAGKIAVAAASLDINQADNDIKLAEFEARLEALQKPPAGIKTVTGRSLDESGKALKDIIAMIDAAELFYSSIEEADKNVKICFDGSKRVFGEKMSPEAQLARANCKDFEGTTAQWDEEIQAVVCNCPGGIDWDENLKKCVDNSKEGRVARLDCSKYPGTYAKWDEKDQSPKCFCPQGLDWNSSENKCVDNSPQGRVARLDCSRYPGTYAKWNDAEQRPKCYCPDGWDWSDGDNKCVDYSPAAQVARSTCKYPNSKPVWDAAKGKVVCSCITDFEWNNAGNACRLKKDIQVAQASCRNLPGMHPGWDSAREEVRCYCDDGSWSSAENRCISQYEQDIAQSQRRRREEEEDRKRREEERRKEEADWKWQQDLFNTAKQKVDRDRQDALEQARQSEIRERQEQEVRWRELDRLKQERENQKAANGKKWAGFGNGSSGGNGNLHMCADPNVPSDKYALSYRRGYGGGDVEYNVKGNTICYRNSYTELTGGSAQNYKCDENFQNCSLNSTTPIDSRNDAGNGGVTYVFKGGETWTTIRPR